MLVIIETYVQLGGAVHPSFSRETWLCHPPRKVLLSSSTCCCWIRTSTRSSVPSCNRRVRSSSPRLSTDMCIYYYKYIHANSCLYNIQESSLLCFEHLQDIVTCFDFTLAVRFHVVSQPKICATLFSILQASTKPCVNIKKSKTTS